MPPTLLAWSRYGPQSSLRMHAWRGVLLPPVVYEKQLYCALLPFAGGRAVVVVVVMVVDAGVGFGDDDDVVVDVVVGAGSVVVVVVVVGAGFDEPHAASTSNAAASFMARILLVAQLGEELLGGLGHGFGEQAELTQSRRRGSPREPDRAARRLAEVRELDGATRLDQRLGGGLGQ
jgi:hypothetical protein